MGTQSALAAMFKTIMTTSGFDGEQQRESIRNTVWFLSEHNKHFDPEIPDQEELECPANDNLDLEPGLQFIISKPNPYLHQFYWKDLILHSNGQFIIYI